VATAGGGNGQRTGLVGGVVGGCARRGAARHQARAGVRRRHAREGMQGFAKGHLSQVKLSFEGVCDKSWERMVETVHADLEYRGDGDAENHPHHPPDARW